jgi:hypothetical protein
MTKHTPTPWEASGFAIYHDGRKPLAEVASDYCADVSSDPDFHRRSGIGEVEATANAEHIVKCVNAHEELVATLAWIAEHGAEYDEIEDRETMVARITERAKATLAKVRS